MRVKLITFFYNESVLIPFYLSHYHWVDMIDAIVSESVDDTEKLLAERDGLNLIRFEFPDRKLDDGIKRDIINERIRVTSPEEYDWIIVVDSDEFLWFNGNPVGDSRAALASVPCEHTYIKLKLWHVYRHKDDQDLNPELFPVVFQRRHGIAERHDHYMKPCVFRTGHNIQLDVGAHRIIAGDQHLSHMQCDGAHWQNADPCFAVTRRVRDRSQHLSDNNIRNGWGFGQYSLTEQKVIDHLKEHENDPEVF
jgi:hypothetical protein